MKYTNKNNLPIIVEKWLLNDEYDYQPGIMSATGLMKPPRAVVLTERHYDSLEMDIADLIAIRYGTAIHSSFEAVPYDSADVEQERRVQAEVDGVKISGKFDMLEQVGVGLYKLHDIKSTSVWNYIYDNKTNDYITQLSVYRYLLAAEGKNVQDEADIIMVFTDWSKKKAAEDPTYPQIRMVVKPITLWSIKDTETWISGRLLLLADARQLPDDELPLCTDDELWKQPDKFAVKAKPDSARAKAVLDSEAAAKQYIEENGGIIEIRKGYVNRCPDYCPCYPFCNQHQRLKEDGYINTGGE
jgi:hypothetical protein